MPRPNPPRKRPRRRPDSVERATRAEVSLARQTAQVKEKNGSSDGKQQSSAKQPAAKARPALKGAAARAQRFNEPWVPWSKRSYAILIVLMAAGELIIGGLAYFTLSGTKPSVGIFLLGINADSLGPLIAVAAALVAAQVAKYITKEPRALRFMESAMAGVTQYFIWFALFVGLLFVFGLGGPAPSSTNSPASSATPLPTGSASPASSATATPSSAASSSSTANGAATITEPVEIAGLALIDILSFVGAYYLYPPVYKRLRVKPPPPRNPPAKKPKPEESTKSSTSKSMVDRMDDASGRDPKAKDPTP